VPNLSTCRRRSQASESAGYRGQKENRTGSHSDMARGYCIKGGTQGRRSLAVAAVLKHPLETGTP
jgi:hypothetical protein